MSLTKEELMNEVYNAELITLGAVGVAVASKKLFRDDLGVPTTAQRIFKLVAAVGGGALLVRFAQKKEIVPKEPKVYKLWQVPLQVEFLTPWHSQELGFCLKIWTKMVSKMK